MTVANRTANAQGVLDFKPGELGENELATLTYATPCGKATIKGAVSPANHEGVVVVDFPAPTTEVTLYFDPALEGHSIEAPRLKISSPKDPYKETSHLRVVFGDCPRTLTIDGRTVKIPESQDPGYVLVAASRQSCYVAGVALFGPLARPCEPEASEKLTGQDAYPIRRRAQRMFEPVPSTAPASRSCTNMNYVQSCR